MYQGIKNKSSTVYVTLLIAILLTGCMSFSNKQLIQQFENLDITITQDDRGLIITLPVLYFDFDSSNLKVNAREKIAEIAAILSHKRAINRQVQILGHTDNVGDPEYNLSLSSERAEVVLKELAFSNISEDRMTFAGKGETIPIHDNSTLQGRQNNRRVEIIILNPN